MVTHVVVFTFAPGTPADAIDTAQRRIEELPAVIDAIGTLRVVRDAGLREGNADMAVVATFDSPEDYLTYADHPVHQAVIVESIRPIISARSAIQYLD